MIQLTPLRRADLAEPSRTRGSSRLRATAWFLCFLYVFPGTVGADDVTVYANRRRQLFAGLGAGAIFFEGHITSLAARNKDERQRELYDDMFSRVRTRYLQLMIRHDHEPENDDDSPWTQTFDEKNFAYCEHTLAIARAARDRQPDIEFFATLYTPPAWMKTNGALSAGGEKRATIKPGMEIELAEFCWAFCAHMHRHGVSIGYLSIANEPDWPHEQPGYCLTAEQHAELFAKVTAYFDRMARRHKDVPRPRFVAPNVLSAVGAAQDWVPRLLRKAARQVDVIGAHDYDRRLNRWRLLRAAAGKRPVWMTEWCQRDEDSSPGLIDSAMSYGEMMHEAFRGGANAWLAYDWVYPPPKGGQSLIHVDWGKDYRLTKIYHLFRQWSGVLPWDSHVVESGQNGKLLANAFLTPDRDAIVVHVLNREEKSKKLQLAIRGGFASALARRLRTSPSEDCAEITDLVTARGVLRDTLPAKSLTTYRFERR